MHVLHELLTSYLARNIAGSIYRSHTLSPNLFAYKRGVDHSMYQQYCHLP